MTKQVPRHESISVAQGEGPGGGGGRCYSGFQVTGMIQCGQNSKPRKIPRASNKTQNNPWTKKHSKLNVCVCFFIIASDVIIREHYRKYSDCFEDPKKHLSQQKKHTWQIFQSKKKPGNENFKPPKILWSSPSLEIRSTFSLTFSHSAPPTL